MTDNDRVVTGRPAMDLEEIRRNAAEYRARMAQETHQHDFQVVGFWARHRDAGHVVLVCLFDQVVRLLNVDVE